MGVHRDAEFNKAHVPGFLRGVEPKQWLTVYPFVRSYEWYLLPPERRGRMLAEHGRMGRAFPQVIANTVASFALGDYEWLLALEADELTDLVDLMRHLRATDARRHVREEMPFFTGRRITTADSSRCRVVAAVNRATGAPAMELRPRAAHRGQSRPRSIRTLRPRRDRAGRDARRAAGAEHVPSRSPTTRCCSPASAVPRVRTT